MSEARLTPCRHFFHSGCLKKWLYVQQTCPMCHHDLSKVSALSATAEPEAAPEANAVQPEPEEHSSDDNDADYETVSNEGADD